MQKTTQQLKEIASQLRRDTLRMVSNVNSGHPGGALGAADYFSVLYFEILEQKKKNDEKGAGEDLFFLSNGHLSAIWYSTLARSGYLKVSDLSKFRLFGSPLQGHPSNNYKIPGIRISSGSLGQGLSVACGAALGKKLNNDDKLTFVLLGDGELQEGQNWEAAMFASAHKIDNLIATIDYNHKQIDGDIDSVIPLGNLKAKWESFGWEVIETDGNNIEELRNSLKEAKQKCQKEKPVMIIMKTIMGKGVDFMEDDHQWHGKALNKEQLEKALKQLPETLGDF